MFYYDNVGIYIYTIFFYEGNFISAGKYFPACMFRRKTSSSNKRSKNIWWKYCIVDTFGGCLILAILAVRADCSKSKHRQIILRYKRKLSRVATANDSQIHKLRQCISPPIKTLTPKFGIAHITRYTEYWLLPSFLQLIMNMFFI